MNKYPVSIAGCGYIGQRLAGRLLARDIDVTGMARTETTIEQCTDQQIRCMQIDFDDMHGTIELSGHRLIYLVPPPRTGKADTRFSGFVNAIESSPPDKLVIISTTGVYGDCAGNWIDESRELKPTADRAFRRLDMEHQAEVFCNIHSIPLVILRVAGIYGPDKLPLARIRSGQPVVNEQDSPYTNRIHADDLVNICDKALSRMDITGKYNVTDGHPSTMYDYFNQVAQMMNLPEPPALSLQEAQRHLSEGMLSYMAESRRIRNDKLLNDFDLELQYPTLKTGLKHC